MGQLGGTRVELAEGDGPLAPVLPREDDGDPVGVRFGNLMDLGPEWDAHGGVRPQEERGRPRPRYAMTLRWTSLVPP